MDAENGPLIPSESSISNAKQKRERLRGAAAEGSEDYISLSLTKRSDEGRGPHPDSRLVREEDELGEGDDGMTFSFCSWAYATNGGCRIRRVYECAGTYSTGQEGQESSS